MVWAGSAMATGTEDDMSELPGWTAPLYQSLTQPQLIAGVSRNFFICIFTLIGTVVLWWTPILLIGGVLYLVAWIGTRYDPDFFEIVLGHVRQHDHYEG